MMFEWNSILAKTWRPPWLSALAEISAEALIPPPWGPLRTQENSRRLSSVGTTSVDCSPPDSGNRLPAIEAAPPPGEPVFEDAIADPADQGRLAARAAGVFVAADPTGKVARVDVLQAGRLTDAGGPEQRLGCGVVGVLHPVVLVEGGDMPGDARRQAAEEVGDVAQLFIAVVEARDDQGDDLQPEPHGVDHLDAVDDVLQLAAQRPVVLVAEGLEVDLVQVRPGPDVLEDLAGGVAVRDVGRRESARPRLLEDLDRPFRRDQRFVIGGGDDAGALPLRDVDQLPGRDIHRIGERPRVAQRLRRDPVLAVVDNRVVGEIRVRPAGLEIEDRSPVVPAADVMDGKEVQ